MSREEEERLARSNPPYYGDQEYNNSFLDRNRENHPVRYPDETRSLRRSPERREDEGLERDNKRKRS